jgi:CMP-N,N'-diacetyllegionaminic acid synthase
MNIVAIIPARSGSKGLKNKNIYPVLKKPLITWTFKQAKKSKLIKNIFVSSDDISIMNLSKKNNIEVISRPKKLCKDNSSSESALVHSLNVIKKKYKIIPDLVVFLQATSPLRRNNDIDKAIKNFINKKLDSLFSVTKINDLCLWQKKNKKWKSVNFDFSKRKPRQYMKQNYIENGSIYIFKPKILFEENNRLGGKIGVYEMDFWQSWEIDTIEEIDLIEFYMKTKGLKN